MSKYIRYLLYLLHHKYLVCIECFRKGLILEGILHDISKFSPSEFIPYAEWFFGGVPKQKKRFSVARDLHRKRNRHHWNYWVTDFKSNCANKIPDKYIIEMICDWRAMGKTMRLSGKEYYLKNKDRMILHPSTRRKIEKLI